MDAIVAEYHNNTDAQLMDLMAQGEALCLGAGLGGKAVIHSSRTITHGRNRGGGVLDVQSVPELVAGISDVSFSWKEVAGAAAVRLPAHGAKARRECEIKNEQMTMQAQGALAPVIRDVPKVAVISCSHNSLKTESRMGCETCHLPVQPRALAGTAQHTYSRPSP